MSAAEMNASAPAPLVRIDDLTIALPKGADRPHAVENLSLTLNAGEIVCVVGESGSGKSMTASALMGLLPPMLPIRGGRIMLGERDIVRRFAKPWRASATGEAQMRQAMLNWDDVKRIKDQHPDLKLILKGIATGEDAQIAVQHGVEVVYVSNHGGRQLDAGRGSIEVLPEVVQAVGGRAKVWVDGGFSRGTDVVKALCLGADLVGLGRLYCYALAADGAAGVVRMLEILENEMRSALGLLGVTAIDQLGPGYVHAAMPTNMPHVHSAFPLLRLDDSGY